jgi:hypothetical protein
VDKIINIDAIQNQRNIFTKRLRILINGTEGFKDLRIPGSRGYRIWQLIVLVL